MCYVDDTFWTENHSCLHIFSLDIKVKLAKYTFLTYFEHNPLLNFYGLKTEK